jgi:hypothetical protein
VNMGPVELLVMLFGLIPLALTLWGIIDTATRPDWAFIQSHQNKPLWLVLQIVGFFLCLGWIVSIVYLASVRPKVAAAQAGYGGPPRAYY